MPFTVSPGSYVGGQLIGQGLAGAGAGVGDALLQYERNKQQDAFSDAMFEYLKTVPGAVPPETLTKFHDMNRNQKNAAIVAAQFALKNRADMQAQEDKRRLELAHANYFQMRANPTNELGANFTPRSTQVSLPGGKKVSMIQRSPQQWERVYEPGEIQYTPEGMPFTVDRFGQIKPQDPGRFFEAKAYKQASDAASATPTPAPDAGGPNILQRALTALGLGKPSGTPAPSPTPAETAAADAGATPGMAPGPADQAGRLLQQARDAITRGADPAQVRQRLQARGIDPNLL